MGSSSEILVDGPAELIPLGFARLRQLEKTWSRFLPDSELNRLQSCRGGWLECSRDLVAALECCFAMHAETRGLFDPTIRTSLELHGYDRTFAEIVEHASSSSVRSPPVPAPGLAGIEIRDNWVRVSDGLSIDLGGIGKGLAADIVADELIVAGANSAYVSLGGDIHAAGEPVDQNGWQVPLLHPSTGATIDHHALYAGALVMSTVAIRRWTRDNMEHHHIIDPRTGRPSATDLIAVAVAAHSAARGEALAKAAIIAGSTDGAALLRAADVKAWMITDDRVVVIQESDQ
ncbi:MAG TPA: FAD:protein FMN transferase [Ilumatobacteraceae bacterium]|jgi:thiamine biosynthesis lipoprotein